MALYYAVHTDTKGVPQGRISYSYAEAVADMSFSTFPMHFQVPLREEGHGTDVFQLVRSIRQTKHGNFLFSLEEGGRVYTVNKAYDEPHGVASTLSFALPGVFVAANVHFHKLPPASDHKTVRPTLCAVSDNSGWLFHGGRVTKMAAVDAGADFRPLHTTDHLFQWPGLRITDARWVPGAQDLICLGYELESAHVARLYMLSESNQWAPIEVARVPFEESNNSRTRILHVDAQANVLISRNDSSIYQLEPHSTLVRQLMRIPGNAIRVEGIPTPDGASCLVCICREEGVPSMVTPGETETRYTEVMFRRVALNHVLTMKADGKSAQSTSDGKCRLATCVPVVEWIDKRTGHAAPHHYQVRFALPRDVHVDSTWHSVYDSASGEPLAIKLPAGRLVASDTPVVVSLFLWRLNRNGEKCQYRAGECRFALHELTSTALDQTRVFYFTDEQNNLQAALRFAKQNGFESLVPGIGPKDPAHNGRLSFQRTYSQQEIMGGLAPRGKVVEEVRRMAVHYMGHERVPVWMVCMLHNDAAVNDAYINHVLEHVTKRLGYQAARDWAVDEKGQNRFEVLGQFLSWYTQQSPYLFDKTYKISKHAFALFDQFSMLRDKPDAKTWAGDCEDFTADMISIFMSLVKMPLEKYAVGSATHRLIRMARSYCAFTVDTTIYNGAQKLVHPPQQDDHKKVDLHMFVVLVPWSSVSAMLQNAHEGKEPALHERVPKGEGLGYPTLMIESTEPCMSDWSVDRKYLFEFSEEAHAAKSVVTDAKKTWCKLRIPATRETYLRDQFYRMFVCLYSQQLFTLTGHAAFLPTALQKLSGKLQCGVSAKSFACFGPQNKMLGLKPLPAPTTEHMYLLKELERRMPWIPPVKFTANHPPDGVAYVMPPAGNRVVQLFAREFEWSKEDEDKLREVLAKMNQLHANKKKYAIAGDKQSVCIMDDVSVVMYQIMCSSS